MKQALTLLIAFLYLFQNVQANGICIIDLDNEIYLPLTNSNINVDINNQIATVSITQSFHNNTGENTTLKFAFPMTETGSALSLRWFNNDQWFTADFSPSPQDTIIPGGGGGGGSNSGPVIDYLGDYPLYFNLDQEVIADSTIIFELTYVDLLPYSFGIVEFFHKNNFTEIQSESLDNFSLEVNLFSDRTIDWIELSNFSNATITNNGNEASLIYSENNFVPNQDINVQYELNANELGLFSFSTFISDTLLSCDEYGEGYMAFIVEPDPSENTEVIDKIFTLIIDNSGSMSGNKMQQARDAASFITNNLNEGDDFNIISFNSTINSFSPNHVPFTATTQTNALAFISNLNAETSTNISGAFSEAIPDFQNSDPEKAKIIIFFTDGQASAGITDTPGILNHINILVNDNEVEDLSIFTFGIGAGANQQLLTLIALQNNGLSEFLGSEELLEAISTFYLTIQNPVLLNTEMFFDPNLVTETYPNPLPNLFKGQQLIVVGRYQQADSVDVHFGGTAFGEDVTYDYGIDLSGESDSVLQFLPRLWAKRKMESLYFEFFAQAPNSAEAQLLEDSISNISLCYGVISPFTSFEDNSGGGTTVSEHTPSEDLGKKIKVIPNPFYNKVEFIFTIPTHLSNELITIEIVDISGKVIYQNQLIGNGLSNWSINWDGRTSHGIESSAGIYFVRIKVGDIIYRTKIVKGF